jgi:hypothetical protein
MCGKQQEEPAAKINPHRRRFTPGPQKDTQRHAIKKVYVKRYTAV